MKEKLFIEDLPLSGKRVLMRVDFNVPLDGEGNVTDATRIKAAIPSIRYVLEKGGSLILMSHLGRPHHAPSPELSLAPVAKVLSEILEKDVHFVSDCIGSSVEKAVHQLKPGKIVLLENLRFHRAEEFPEEAPEFAKELASYGDYYVNEAFGSAHRKHSSTYTIATYFPSGAAAGYLMEKEIHYLEEVLSQPKRPFHAVIGGAKISSKIGVLHALIQKVDGLLIGGAMAYTFLKAKGYAIGSTLFEEKYLSKAQEILQSVKEKQITLLLPTDSLICREICDDALTQSVSVSQGIPNGWQGVDIGPETIVRFTSFLKDAKTILWNGPVGVFECTPFSKGTYAIAKELASSQALTVIGGGDSIAAVNQMGLSDQITHLSTGGGATLEYIELGTLPGIEVLTDKKR